MALPDVNALDVQWIVGYLEGEGCFFFTGYHKTCPIIQVAATDQDVVEKAASLMGVPLAKIKTEKRAHKNPRHKDVYKFYVGSDLAVFWMRTILPHMGSRRKETIEKILHLYDGVMASRKACGS